jgi:hypothetical protein
MMWERRRDINGSMRWWSECVDSQMVRQMSQTDREFRINEIVNSEK